MSSSVGTVQAAAKLEAIEAINREPSFTSEVKQALIEAYLKEDISVEGAQSAQLSFIVGSNGGGSGGKVQHHTVFLHGKIFVIWGTC